jgi:hypothetical protein
VKDIKQMSVKGEKRFLLHRITVTRCSTGPITKMNYPKVFISTFGVLFSIIITGCSSKQKNREAFI